MIRTSFGAVVVALLAAACGQAGPAGGGEDAGGAPATPRTVVVALEHNGETINVDRGGVVELDLAAAEGPPRRWVLASYPKGLLDLTSSERRGARYEFEVSARGRGRILAVDLTGSRLTEACEKPIAFETTQCPAAKSLDELGRRPRPGLFAVTLVAG
jgi:hypothetical protein